MAPAEGIRVPLGTCSIYMLAAFFSVWLGRLSGYAKRCKCCKHLSTKSTVTSSVNGRQFSIINKSDLD